MRKAFATEIQKIATEDKSVLFFTGDLGFMALESLQAAIGRRFVNVGVSEQNMVTMAAATASRGHTTFCYSIAPFAVFRPAEQIRLDVCLHNQNVKIVGNGGGYGYGIMGSTHHALEDIAVLSSFQNMVCYIPFCDEDVQDVMTAMMKRNGPAYLRLGVGQKPNHVIIPKYHHTRRVLKGNKLTIIAMGPVALNAANAAAEAGHEVADLFIISEVPVIELTPELKRSIQQSGKVLVVEEHVKRGGLGEGLAALMLENGLSPRFRQLYAKGYPNGRYGSQQYHQKLSGLDEESISSVIKEIIYEA